MRDGVVRYVGHVEWAIAESRHRIVVGRLNGLLVVGRLGLQGREPRGLLRLGLLLRWLRAKLLVVRGRLKLLHRGRGGEDRRLYAG